jgi:hypothetical protein
MLMSGVRKMGALIRTFGFDSGIRVSEFGFFDGPFVTEQDEK